MSVSISTLSLTHSLVARIICSEFIFQFCKWGVYGNH